jgi:hypothetical protein
MTVMPASYGNIIDPFVATSREILEWGQQLVLFALVGNLTTTDHH